MRGWQADKDLLEGIEKLWLAGLCGQGGDATDGGLEKGGGCLLLWCGGVVWWSVVWCGVMVWCDVMWCVVRYSVVVWQCVVVCGAVWWCGGVW